MGNALNEDITGRYVIIKEEVLAPQYRTIENQVFLVSGGFGAVPFTSGTAVLGESPIDGERWRVEGYNIERYATDEEIALVTKKEGT